MSLLTTQSPYVNHFMIRTFYLYVQFPKSKKRFLINGFLKMQKPTLLARLNTH